MFLVSWNVAGWVTTTSAIRGAFGSLEAFFRLLDADILCLQETKISKAKLDKDEVTCGAADRPGFPLAGYESFWSYSTPRGMNGVCTFVRTGLTHRVDATPFGVDALDREGRCIVTYHSHFSVFNVYVPNSRNGERQAFKGEFLAALKGAMDRVRKETTLPVMLVGDMNVTYRTEDCHFSNRKLCLRSLSAALYAAGTDECAAATPASHPSFTAAANDDDDRTDSSPPKRFFSKRQPLSEDESLVLVKLVPYLEEHVSIKLGREIAFSPSGARATTSERHRTFLEAAERVEHLRNALRSDRGVATQASTSRTVTGDSDANEPLQEEAFRDYVWVESLVRGSANTASPRNEVLYVASECIGLPCHSARDVAFAQSLLSDSVAPMVDTFVMVTEGWDAATTGQQLVGVPGCPRSRRQGGPATLSFPQPFTCWDQYRNKRYENEGNRIDYVFADASLIRSFVPQQCTSQPNAAMDEGTPRQLDEDGGPLSGFNGQMRRLGLIRATANGRYAAAPTSGGGMDKLRDVDKLIMFEGDGGPAGTHRRSGLLVTPPQYSDHIGVTLLLEKCSSSTHVGVASSTPTWLVPRPTGTPLTDPGNVLFRRKSANLMSMFAKVAASKAPVVQSPAPPEPCDGDAHERTVVKRQREAADECSRITAGGAQAAGTNNGGTTAQQAAHFKGKHAEVICID